MAEKKHPTVYSTDLGRLCPDCGMIKSACSCRRVVTAAGSGTNIRVGRETKGRKGKGVTVISGLPLTGVALDALASQLKKRCGCGGTVKDGKIEIQGDQRGLLLQELERLGYVAKRCGG